MTICIYPCQTFSINDMITNLAVLGYYCYHDSIVKSIALDSLSWTELQPNFYVAQDKDVVSKLISHQHKVFQEFFPLEVVSCLIYEGVDQFTNDWHTDHIEKIDLQMLCYKTNFGIQDGGELGLKCYDGIERLYRPSNGDVMILNHKVGITHKVFPIRHKKKRIVINLSCKVHNNVF